MASFSAPATSDILYKANVEVFCSHIDRSKYIASSKRFAKAFRGRSCSCVYPATTRTKHLLYHFACSGSSSLVEVQVNERARSR